MDVDDILCIGMSWGAENLLERREKDERREEYCLKQPLRNKLVQDVHNHIQNTESCGLFIWRRDRESYRDDYCPALRIYQEKTKLWNLPAKRQKVNL